MKAMKKHILLLSCMIILFSACGDFLEYKDKDKVIPTKLEHYNEMIFGELLLADASSALVYLDLMTDDVESFVSDEVSSWSTDSRQKYYGYYTWAEEPQYDMNGSKVADEAWKFFYHKVLMCNIIEKEVNELENDMQGVKERLLGEVRFLRAQTNFFLVNMYGAPYEDENQAKTAMGIPLNKATGIYDKIYTRSTLAEVYQAIEKDLLDAQKNFERGEKKATIFRPGLSAVQILLSRFYLFSKRYEECINYASAAINTSGMIIEARSTMETEKYYLYHRRNPGIVLTWGKGAQGPLYADYYNAGKYIMSKELERGYVGGDARLKGFFGIYQGSYYPQKSYKEEIYRWTIRIEEAYLNRAEAYIELGKEWQQGVQDVNMIRTQRVKDFTAPVITTQAEARDYCRQERRLELCFEDFRWFDIRRWGLEVTHRYHNFPNKETYKEFKLTKNSINYILPLPLDEQEINEDMERPQRIDCEVKP